MITLIGIFGDEIPLSGGARQNSDESEQIPLDFGIGQPLIFLDQID